MQKITPCLWFEKNAEEAMNFYVSIFKNSKIIRIDRYPEGYTEGPLANMAGKVINGEFELDGQRFICLDGGPTFKLSEAVSFVIDCADQEEVDYYWEKLSSNPENEQCGWCKDKYGLSWQVIPKKLGELLNDPDKEKARRVMDVMLEQKKIVVADLEKAYRGE